jgi:hypothetical protein
MHADAANSLFVKSLTLATLAVVLATTGVAAQPAKLPPSEIQSTFFNGQPFTASTLSNVKYKMTFLADGKMKREPIGGGNKGEGTWKLSKDGFCTTWNGATMANCFTLVSAGTNKWSVLKGSTIQAIWTK